MDSGKSFDKRQCTVGLTLHGNGKQLIKATMTFRDEELRSSEKERNQSATGVCHWFQASARMVLACLTNYITLTTAEMRMVAITSWIMMLLFRLMMMLLFRMISQRNVHRKLATH